MGFFGKDDDFMNKKPETKLTKQEIIENEDDDDNNIVPIYIYKFLLTSDKEVFICGTEVCADEDTCTYDVYCGFADDDGTVSLDSDYEDDWDDNIIAQFTCDNVYYWQEIKRISYEEYEKIIENDNLLEEVVKSN